MTALGSYFKNKREEEGISLEEVADQTNISSRYLKAIEEQNFEQFPADVYAKGFIRSYAEHLDLDAQAMVMEYSLNFEQNQQDNNNKNNKNNFLYWIFIIALILLGIGVLLLRFAWFYPKKKKHVDYFKKQSRVNNIQKKSTYQEKVISLSEPIPKKLKVNVIATRQTWAYAIFDGMRKEEFMFQSGDKIKWEAKETIRFWLSDGGALRLYFEDNVLPPLGKKGQAVDRIISLRDGKLHVKSPGGG